MASQAGWLIMQAVQPSRLVNHAGQWNMQAVMVNHTGWLTIMQAYQPYKLVDHAGWLTMQVG